MKTNETQIKNGLKSLEARGNKLSELVCAIAEKNGLHTDESASHLSADDLRVEGMTDDEVAAMFYALCNGTRCNLDAAAHVINFGW